VTKTNGRANRCAVAAACALLLGTAAIPAAYGDDGEDPTVVVIPLPLPSGETPPEQQTPPPSDEPAPGPGPVPEPVPVPEPMPVPEPVPVSDPVPNPVRPSTTETLSAGNAQPNVRDGSRLELPLLPPSNVAGSAAVNGEAALPTDEAAPTPQPTISPEASAAAVPIALPQPVTKTIDAVVATATGSPLYVQLLTVLVLIGAGIAYFRVLGSKGTRVPSKSVK
jgi:hypothetical protein